MFFRTINQYYVLEVILWIYISKILYLLVKDWYVFSQISVHLIQYFIGFHTIIYFSGNEELPSLCVKKGTKQVKWKKSNLFYVGRWIAKHLINKPTDVEMKAIDRLWKTIYTVNSYFWKKNETILRAKTKYFPATNELLIGVNRID